MKTSSNDDEKDLHDSKVTAEKSTQTIEIRNYQEITSYDQLHLSKKQKEEQVKEHIKKLIRQKSNDTSGKLGIGNTARIGPIEDVIFNVV